MANLKDIIGKARRVITRKGTDAQDSEDLVHDAYIRVLEYERRDTVKSEEALVVTTAKNLALNARRRRYNAPFITGDTGDFDAIDEKPPVDEQLIAREQLRRLAEGLAQLPPRTRRILMSRRLEGRSYKEIAAEEDMSVAAVEKQVARATLHLLSWVKP